MKAKNGMASKIGVGVGVFVAGGYLIYGVIVGHHVNDKSGDISDANKFAASCLSLKTDLSDLSDCVKYYDQTLPIVKRAEDGKWPLTAGPLEEQYDDTYKIVKADVEVYNKSVSDPSKKLTLDSYQ